MESTLTRRGLNGNQLKLIAITAMTIDHLAWTLWPGYSHNPAAIACHIMGRLTAPIMWFFIVEGYHYTHDVNKYTLRLFILALVSHFAYNFCFGISFVPLKDGVFNQTSVAWSLAWGLVLLRINAPAALAEGRYSFCSMRNNLPIGLELRSCRCNSFHG